MAAHRSRGCVEVCVCACVCVSLRVWLKLAAHCELEYSMCV